MQEKITYTSHTNSDFSEALKQRVENYFAKQNLSKKCNRLMVLKSGCYLLGFVSTYLLLIFGGFSEIGMLALAILLGFFISGIGFNIGHDAVHGAYSQSPRVNKIMSYSFDLIGASSYTWKVRHNFLHHINTNIVGSDGDLESIPLLRFCLKPGRKFIHSFQHLYAPFLYGFVTLVWVLKKDYVHILEERREQHSRRKPPVSAYIALIFFKFLHYLLFIGIPFLVLGLALWKVMFGFLIMHFIAGFTLASIFQLAHVVEGPAFVYPTDSNTIVDSWAAHQLKSTANFEPRPLITWICGGLNYQIEHHLFPNICHIHYPALSPIVEKTAKEFNLPYYVHGTFFKAFHSHLRTLKYFGNTDPVPAH